MHILGLDMNPTLTSRLAVCTVAWCISFFSTGSHAREPQSSPDAFIGLATADVAHCMATVYEVGLAVSARALGGSQAQFELALLAYDEDAHACFEEAAGYLTELEAPRQDSELASDQERFRMLLAQAREWDGDPEHAVPLIEASRSLGQRLEAVCGELSLLEDEELASAR